MTGNRVFKLALPFLVVCALFVVRSDRAYAGLPNFNDPSSILSNKFPDPRTVDSRPGTQNNYYMEIAQAGSGIYLDARAGGVVAYFTPGTDIFDVTIEDGQWGCSVDTGGNSSPATDTVFTFTPIGVDASGGPNYAGAKSAAGYSVYGATMGCGAYSVRLSDVGFAPTAVSNKNLLAVMVSVSWNGNVGGRINAFKISAQGYTGTPKSATPNATYVGAIAQEQFGLYPYAIQRRLPGSGTFDDNMSFYARISCNAEINTPNRQISLSWNDADRGGAPEGAIPYDNNINFKVNQYRNGNLINTIPLDIPIALGGQNAKRSITFRNLGSGNFRITINMGAYGDLVVYDSSAGINIIGATNSVGVQPGDIFGWSWDGVDRTNGIQLWSPFDTVDILDTNCPPPPPVARCDITAITNMGFGSTIQSGEQFRFNVRTTDAAGYVLGVNGPNWGNPGAWGNYIVSGSQYIRTPVPANGNQDVTLFRYGDSGPFDQGFYATDTGTSSGRPLAAGTYQFNWGLVIPGVSWATDTCPATLTVTSPDTRPTQVSISQYCSDPQYGVTITVSDPDYATNALRPIINYSLNGGPVQSVRSGAGGSINVAMPNPLASMTITANSNGVNPSPPGGDAPNSSNVVNNTYDGTNNRIQPCAFEFTVQSSPDMAILDDDENPTLATFSSRASITTTAPQVNGLRAEREFFVNRGGVYNPADGTLTGVGSCVLAYGGTPATDSQANITLTAKSPATEPIMTTTTRQLTNPPYPGCGNWSLPFRAGDYICIREDVIPQRGWVDRSNNLIPSKSADVARRKNCKSIVDRPYFRAFGNDVYSGAGFGTGCAATTTNIIGFAKRVGTSWVGSGAQLGVFAGGDVRGFTSRSMVDTGRASDLTFSNVSPVAGTNGGRFGATFCSDNFWASRSTTITTTPGIPPPLQNLANGQHQFSSGSTITATGTVNNRIAVYIDGDLRIGGSGITTSTSWASIANIPSVYVVVRGNIYIAPSVTQLDGIYVAQPNATSPLGGGRIFTCADITSATPQTATFTFLVNTCRTKLTVNGALVATKVNFLRTSGSLRTATAVEPMTSNNIAEVIRFVPDAFMSQPASNSEQQVGNFDAVISLPPSL